ncbi:coatomer [Striga asiatica]|uniref:Coatomer n=1 Tax=Striga asiatica TaxID=4170 RepID=A0A5A7PLN0_STRAF|nr:coatomer [Striga asiatica]
MASAVSNEHRSCPAAACEVLQQMFAGKLLLVEKNTVLLADEGVAAHRKNSNDMTMAVVLERDLQIRTGLNFFYMDEQSAICCCSIWAIASRCWSEKETDGTIARCCSSHHGYLIAAVGLPTKGDETSGALDEPIEPAACRKKSCDGGRSPAMAEELPDANRTPVYLAATTSHPSGSVLEISDAGPGIQAATAPKTSSAGLMQTSDVGLTSQQRRSSSRRSRPMSQPSPT